MRSSSLNKSSWPEFQQFPRLRFSRSRPRRGRIDLRSRAADSRIEVRAAAPLTGGVYGLLDQGGALIYVGMSHQLRKRLLCYFGSGEASRKELRLGARARAVAWEEVGHELITPLRELELIRHFRPPCNVRGRRLKKRTAFVRLVRDAAPRFEVCDAVDLGGEPSWGPLARGRRLQRSVDAVNRYFRLPDCQLTTPERLSGHLPLHDNLLRFACLRGDLGGCLAPCVGGASHADYERQLQAATALLDGRDETPLAQLEQEMAEAAAARRFEKAARLRNDLDALAELCRRVAPVRAPTDRRTVFCPVQLGRKPYWCLIHAGAAAGLWRAPDSPRRAAAVLAQLECVAKMPADEVGVDHENACIVRRWLTVEDEFSRETLSLSAARRQCRAALRK